jgi:penicillin-binding protein 2
VHLENIDFAGKTGTAQVVNHSAGMKSLGTGAARANAWFVGVAPRRNPDIAVVVLVEHGGWGAEASAPLAARIIESFVDKQRRLDNNLQEAKVPAKVEVGAVWSEPPESSPEAAKVTTAAVKEPTPAMHGGHFDLPVAAVQHKE